MESTNILKNNHINQFILRFDLEKSCPINFEQLVLDLRPNFSNLKQELHDNYAVDMQSVEVKKETFITYVLSKGDGVSVRLDTFGKSIVFKVDSYVTNAIYKDYVSCVIENINKQSIQTEVNASRIGMRFINNFPCAKIEDISKIINLSESRAVKSILKKENMSRAIIVEEHQNDGFRIKVQYGVPNRFYPAILSNYDLLLDIDVYCNGLQNIDLWKDNIREYNHAAYKYFSEFIKPTYMETMK